MPAALPSIFVGLRLGLIFALINIVGVEFLINFGGLGQLINELAERYDLPGTYGAIGFVILVSILFFVACERAERWLLPHDIVDFASPARDRPLRVWAVRAAHHPGAARDLGGRRRVRVAVPDVVPTLPVIARAIVRLLSDRGLLCESRGDRARNRAPRSRSAALREWPSGLLLGGSRFLSRAYEGFIYYLGPDAEDHLLSRS